MKSLKFTVPFLIGGTIGAALTALSSPISGKERRERITLFLNQTADDLNDIAYNLQRVRQSLDQLARTANETLPAFKKDMEQTLNDFKFQAEPRIDVINASIEQLQNDLESH